MRVKMACIHFTPLWCGGSTKETESGTQKNGTILFGMNFLGLQNYDYNTNTAKKWYNLVWDKWIKTTKEYLL
jgi:hypothetical protein